MRIIARPVLSDFARLHADAADDLGTWYHLVKRARYRTPHEVQRDFPSASFLGDGVTVFNVASQYRLQVHMRYDLGIVFIQGLMTHAEYDRLNKARRKK
jgi:mRNA interferase HigB